MGEREATAGGTFWGDADAAPPGGASGLVNAVGDGIYQLDADGRFVGANDAFVETAGYDRTTLFGRHVSVVHDDGTATRLEAAGRAGETVDATIRTADGDAIPCELRPSPVAGGVAVVVREVSRAARDRELRRYERIVDNLPVGVYRNTPGPDGEFVEANETLAEIFDADSVDDLLGRPVSDLYPDPGERLEFSRRLEREGVVRDVELDQETLAGEPIRISVTAIRTEEDGEVYFDGIVEDVTERREMERELRERQRRLSTLIDNVPGMVYRCRAERGRPMEFVSDACRDLTGYDSEAFERDALEWGEDVVVPEDREPLWEAVRHETDEGEAFSETYRIETADGDVRWVRDHGRGVYHDGDLVAIEGIVEDVTERKRAEERLAEERDVFARGPTVVFRWAPDEEAGWPVEYVSENVADVLGYTAAELESGAVSYTDLLLEEEVDRIAREVEAAVDEGTERFDHDPYRVRTKDGDVRWVKDVTKIVRDEDGAVESYLGYLVDVTDRTERERELERYETIVEAVDDGVYVVDDDGRFTMVNEAYAELVGYDREELVGEHVSAVVDEDVVERARRTETTLREGETTAPPIEAELETGDGDRVPAEATFALLPTDEGDERRVGVVRDISERRERERELERKERRYEAVFEDPNILVGLLDPDGTVIDINETAMEYVAADLGEVVGEPFWETPWWGEGDGVGDDVREWTERAAAGEYVDFEADLTRPDGRRYTLSGYFRPVTDDDGEVVSIIVSDRDVTERKRRERELEESERRYRTLVENFPNGAVALVDEELRYRTVGGSPSDVADVTVAEAEGRPVEEAVPSDLAAELVPQYEAALEGESDSFEIELDGGAYQFHVVPVRDESGEVFAALGTSQDVTEQRERERKLEQYRRILETIDDGVYVLDGDSRFLTVNEAFADMLGRDRDSLIGAHASVAFGQEQVDRAERLHRDLIEGETDIAQLDEHVETADGEIPVVTRFTLFETDDEVGRVGVVRDVTERKRRERELEESERRYRTLAESFPNGTVTLFDDDLEYTLAAGRGFDRIPVAPDDLEGESVRDAWDDETAAKLEPAFEAALSGEERSVELAYEGREWIVHVVPIADERGDVFAGMTMAQDITEQKERERYLEDAKSQLEAATEAGAVGTWEWHVPEDRFVAGASLAREFGVDPEAAREGVSLDQFLDGVHEADRDRVERRIESALDRCGEYEAEYRVWDADGSLRWVVARGHVECDEDGDPVRFPGAITDITERKRAELELERNKEQLETLFELLPVGVIVAEVDGELVADNDASREIWGGDVLDADSVEEYDRYPIYDADTGEPVPPEEVTLARVLDGEEVLEPDVYEIEAADGERRIIEAQGMPIRNEDGAVIRGVATLSDVTERREAQRRLAESERRYRSLVENFPNGAVGLFDANLEYTVVGGEMIDELDVSKAEIVGETVRERYPEDVAEVMEPNFRAALSGETNTFELQFHGREWLVTTVPVGDGTGASAGVVMVQDVTERKEYRRKLEDSNERLEQFAYAVSHDLQEPLRMVTSYLQLLESRYADDLDADAREFIEFAVDGADRMREMIQGLLEYSRVETRGDPLEPVDLDAVLADVRKDLEIRIEETDATVAVDDLPRVEGDASQLRQLFQNLLDNALEYSGEAPPRVEVTAERAGREWLVSVRDEGIGIDPADHDRIFEVFERLHGRDEHDGTGIGLALCERIVERHGGEIRVDSEPGEGTTVSVALPAAEE